MAIATGKGDVRSRVCVACKILDGISNAERSMFPTSIQRALSELITEAGKNGPYVNPHTKLIEIDKFENTMRGRQNQTYMALAEVVFKLNEAINNGREVSFDRLRRYRSKGSRG